VIRVYIHDDFMSGLNLAVVNHIDEQTAHILRLDSETSQQRWEPLDTSGTAQPQPRTLRLPYDTGRALLDALAHHYEGSEDTRRLRADYDAALKRADAKDELVADVLRTLAGKVGA
jgi:hypothetical protein